MKTVTNETIIKFGPTFAMPGHFLCDFEKDLRIISDVAEGGGGAIKLAEMLNSFQGDLDEKEVILKLIKSSQTWEDGPKLCLDARAIWQQEICIMW